MSVGHSARNYSANNFIDKIGLKKVPRDVNGRVLFLAAHHIEAETLVRLRELDNPRMGMSLGCGKCRHCCFGCRWCSDLYFLFYFHNSKVPLRIHRDQSYRRRSRRLPEQRRKNRIGVSSAGWGVWPNWPRPSSAHVLSAPEFCGYLKHELWVDVFFRAYSTYFRGRM